MIHTTSLTMPHDAGAVVPVQSKYVLVQVTLKGAQMDLTGHIQRENGGYVGKVNIMGKEVKSDWEVSLKSAQSGLQKNAQGLIDKLGIRERQHEHEFAGAM